MTWRPIQPGDDIAVRVEKLAQNLDELWAYGQQLRGQDHQWIQEIEDELSTRLTALDQLVATRHQDSKRAETAAMRWELRGLVITLVGTGLAVLGSTIG